MVEGTEALSMRVCSGLGQAWWHECCNLIGAFQQPTHDGVVMPQIHLTVT